MNLHSLRCVGILLTMGAAAFSQNAAVLIGTGYSAPPPMQVAPGQVVTLFVRGVSPSANGHLRSERSTGSPATSLAGVAAQVIQSQFLFNVPILAVQQKNECETVGVLTASCLLTAIKVQVPFEIKADVTQKVPAGPVTLSPVAQLILTVDGRPSGSFVLQPVPDNAHVLTTCDADWDTSADAVCDRQAFHLDGRPVNEAAPATPGETISLQFFGLGQTSPPAATGVYSQPGMFLTDVLGYPRVTVTFQPLVNAPSSIPRHAHTPDAKEVRSAIAGGALLGGAIGIYQLQVIFPESLEPPVPCGNGVHTNYVMNVITSQGTEQVAVCVQR